MAQKIVSLPQIGRVVLAKRRGSKNIRLSVGADGQVRVGLPYWLPYATGISFAQKRADWIKRHQAKHQPVVLKSGDVIGKSFRLQVVYDPLAERITSRLVGNDIKLISNLPPTAVATQQKAAAACERALKAEAQRLLVDRTAELARRHGLLYHQVRIVKLKSRWGSCSSEKVISLSYFLVQLPWELIDYVIIHELLHTRHLNHSHDFWDSFEALTPGAKAKRQAMRTHRPVVTPNSA